MTLEAENKLVRMMCHAAKVFVVVPKGHTGWWGENPAVMGGGSSDPAYLLTSTHLIDNFYNQTFRRTSPMTGVLATSPFFKFVSHLFLWNTMNAFQETLSENVRIYPHI